MAAYLPAREANFVFWGQNFKNISFANQVALNLTAPEFAEIEDAANGCDAALAAVIVAKDVLAGAVAAKREAFETANEVFRRYGMEFKNNPTVSEELKGQLGLNVNPTPAGSVAIPLDFTATPFTNGTVKLAWNRNGNPYRTVFKIESQAAGESTWTMVDSVTASRYTVADAPVGQQMTYRVRASRGGVTSGASNSSTVYPNSESSVLQLEEAA